MSDPERLGRYRILRPIGQGGMGLVYLATDGETGSPARVAIKVLRQTLHTPEYVARFHAERQILASLDHPNIARLLEGGMTPDGRPFLVMEYVAGQTLDEYCDRRRLRIRERLGLFRSVCQAVSYAHSQLVVHRDIKPRNVLVTEEGVVKLVDFGIAKLLAAGGGFAETGATHTAAQLMTPEYASPEQVTGDRISTATDVYALGLLLYELLSGIRAQRFSIASISEIERVVVREDPAPPSEALSAAMHTPADGVSADALATARGTTPARLVRRLRGDLDRMVLMAMRKEPERRYVSVSLLADDVERYLGGQPVVARGASATYRLQKFVLRNRVAVTACASAVVMVVGYAWVAHRHALDMERAAARARLEATKANEVSDFLVSLFDAAGPDAAQGRTVGTTELLEEGLRRADALSAQPAAQAQLLDAIGRVYQSLGQFSRARELLERGLALRRTSLGSQHADVGHSLRHVGIASRLEGRLEAADQALREALAIDQREHGAEAPDVATDLHELGTVLVEQGKFAEGQALLRQGLDVRRRLLGPTHEEVASSLSALAYALSREGHPREADPIYREALAVREARLGPRHPEVARDRQNLAAVLSDNGEFDEARTHLLSALETYRAVYGNAHPSIAVTLNNLGNLMARKGELDEAERLFRESAAMRRQLLGDTHPSTVRALNNVASVLMRKGDLAESERVFREILAIRLAAPEGDQADVPLLKSNLAEALRRQGRLDDAEPLAREALAAEQRPGTHTLTEASILTILGRILSDRGAMAEAEQRLTTALEIRRERQGADHADTQRVQGYLDALRGHSKAAAR